MQIRTIVVDHSPAALSSICTEVDRRCELLFVGAATSAGNALVLARSLQPDLVLLDLEIPVMSGVDAASSIIRDCPMTEVVIVTPYDSPELRKLCRDRGARGFIRKDMLHQQLPIVVHQLFEDKELD